MGKAKAEWPVIRRFFMDLGRLICSPLLLWWRFRKLTPQGKPYKGTPRGGVLVAANHTSFADPLAIGTCFAGRRVFFLAAESVMDHPVLGTLMRGMGCIRIDRRTHDIEGIKKAVSVLKAGHMLTVFPQGTIVREDRSLESLKTGVLLLAVQAGVPILPVFSRPAAHWWRRRIAVIGNPVTVTCPAGTRFLPATEMDRLAAELQQELNRCRDTFEQIQGGTK